MKKDSRKNGHKGEKGKKRVAHLIGPTIVVGADRGQAESGPPWCLTRRCGPTSDRLGRDQKLKNCRKAAVMVKKGSRGAADAKAADAAAECNCAMWNMSKDPKMDKPLL